MPDYATHLGWLAIDAIALFALSRLWISTGRAMAAALLYVCGLPVAVMATQLMVMHYLQSVAFAALATLTFVLALRRSPRMAYLSSALYLMAMLAKEIAVPLPLLLAIIPEGQARQRRRALVPHVAALAVYAIWRTAMLHTPFGGYGWAPRDLVQLLTSLPLKVGLALGAGAAVMLIGAFAALRTRRGALLVIVGLLIAVGPIAPMSAHLEERFTLGAWLWLALAFVFGIAAFRPTIAVALIAAALSVTIVANRQRWQSELELASRMSSEARAFFTLGSNGVLRDPLIPPAAIAELRWLKEDHERKERGGAWFYDEIFLCNGNANGKRGWQYEAGNIVDITPRIPRLTRTYCGSIRAKAPMTVTFHHEGDVLSWSFGPYTNGAWRVVIGDGVQAFDVPPTDAFHLGPLPGISLRIRYASPEGWVTYSPEMNLDFVHHPDSSWRR